MLMPYLVRYRLSSCRSRLHGKLSQSTQNELVPLAMVSHVLILHVRQYRGLATSSPLHPGHRFLSLRWPRQSPQSMPQGAISSTVSDSGRTFGTARTAPPLDNLTNAHCQRAVRQPLTAGKSYSITLAETERERNGCPRSSISRTCLRLVWSPRL